MPRSRATCAAGTSASTSRAAVLIWLAVNRGGRPPRSPPEARRFATESATRSRLMSNSIWASAAMTVKTIDPIGVEVSTSPPPRLEDAKAGAAAAQLLGEVEHVLRRSPEPVARRDHECVALVQCFECSVELGTARSIARDAVVDVEVVASDAGAEEVSDLLVG